MDRSSGNHGKILNNMVASVLFTIALLYSYRALEGYSFEPGRAKQGTIRTVDSILPAQSLAEQAPPDFLLEEALLTPTATPTPVPTPTPRKPKEALPATWIRIPAIDVDSAVVHAPIVDGEWQLPKFVVGHLEGTANPGGTGNTVLSGHVQSLASGNVFAQLEGLSVGDEVSLLIGEEPVRYLVAEIKVVENDDLSVVMPTKEPILTLITCTGRWDPFAGQYTHRLIVVAKPVS